VYGGARIYPAGRHSMQGHTGICVYITVQEENWQQGAHSCLAYCCYYCKPTHNSHEKGDKFDGFLMGNVVELLHLRWGCAILFKAPLDIIVEHMVMFGEET